MTTYVGILACSLIKLRWVRVAEDYLMWKFLEREWARLLCRLVVECLWAEVDFKSGSDSKFQGDIDSPILAYLITFNILL